MAELFNITLDDVTLDEFDSTVEDSGDLSASGAAALGGSTAGLSCLIDDATWIYGIVTQANPASNEIRFRFYIDPNTLTMGTTEAFWVLIWRDTGGTWPFSINFRWVSGTGYQLYFHARDDEDVDDKFLGWYNITDAPHWVEVYLKRESGDGNDDGVLTVWIDGTQQGTHTDVDNWTVMSIAEQFRIGAVNGIDYPGTQGTFYLDEFVCRDDDQWVGERSQGELFNITVDDGTFDEFDSTVEDSGDLSVAAAAALGGSTFGISCLLDDDTDIYGVLNRSMPGSGTFRIRVYVDPNGLTMTDTDEFYIARFWKNGTGNALMINVNQQSGSYYLNARAYEDDDNTIAREVIITDAPHYIEALVTRASSATADDGVLQVFVDGVQVGTTFSALDNYDRWAAIDEFRFGAGQIDAGTGGVGETFYLDEIVARDDGKLIGARPTGELFNITHDDGTLDEYDATVTDSGDLSVEGGAALGNSTFGLSCLIDDANPIYGEINQAFPETGILRVRFYVDPNNLTMSEADAFYVLVLPAISNWACCVVQLNYNSGSYNMKLGMVDDGLATSWMGANITDAPHYVEILFQRASSAVASDGFGHIFVDGVWEGSITDVDNYDILTEVTEIQFGAVTGIDYPDTQGTFYLDELLANDTGKLIGARPIGELFNITHDDGTLDEYDSLTDPDSDLSATAAAVMGGSVYGMSVIIDDQVACYGTKLQAAPSSGKFRLRIYIDPNTLAMNDWEEFTFVFCRSIYAPTGNSMWGLSLRDHTANQFAVYWTIRDDGGGDALREFVLISDAPHYIELYFTQASDALANDGSAQWWVDGVQQTGVAAFDNYDVFAGFDRFRVGACSGVDSGTSGTFYLDEFIANDTGKYIGTRPVGKLVDIGHETGDLTEYDSLVDPDNDLSAVVAAALAGTAYGLACIIDDAVAFRAIASVSVDTGELRVRIYVDPNTLTMATNDAFIYFAVRASSAPYNLAYLGLTYGVSDYYFDMLVFDDAGSGAGYDNVVISDGPHWVEIRLRRASTETSFDGEFEWWVDDVQQGLVSDIDNYDAFAFISAIWIGGHSGMDYPDTQGTFYLDQLVVRDDGSEIGSVALTIPVMMHHYRSLRM